MSGEYKYIRLCRGVFDSGKLIEEKDRLDLIDSEHDWYESLYYYNQDQYNAFQEKNSIKGMKDVVTDKLVFDFDNEANPDTARQEAKAITYKLINLGIKPDNIQYYFSGNKGFNIVILLDRFLTPPQVQQVVSKLTPDLIMDRSLYDHSQLLRIPFTKHQKSHLYKIPLTYEQFTTASLDDIKQLASNLDAVDESKFTEVRVSLPEKYFDFAEEKVRTKTTGLDWSKKPKNWRNCKWALLQGEFRSGERDHAMMILASTCRALGYDRETSYYMCKSALKKSWAKYGQGDFSKEELWNNIIENSIFSDNWEGGQYSCKSDLWLKNYCQALGEHKCIQAEELDSCITVDNLHSEFKVFSQDFEKNIIKTGIESLDDNTVLLTHTLVGLLGQPGAGKTTAALNYLRHTSENDIPSILFSLDMGKPIIYGNLVKKATGYDFKEVLKMYKEDPRKAEEIYNKFKESYKNVGFNFRAGLTIADMKELIKSHEDKIGQKVKLVIVDYLECLAGPYSDQTANVGFIANQLKDLANELGVCVFLLLQTQKHSTPEISDPLLTLKGVKGSSLIEQSCSTIITLWREGYNPDTVKDDKFISFAVVKNRFGALWRGDFSWDGVRGNISELNDIQRSTLTAFKDRKKQKKAEQLMAKVEQMASEWE